MIQSLAKAIVYPVHLLRGERLDRYVPEVLAINASSAEDIEQYRKLRLTEVLRSAIDTGHPAFTGFRHWSQRVTPTSVDAVWADFPLQSKELMRSVVAHLPKRDDLTLEPRSTSGSTGLPFRFYKDRRATGYMEAVAYAAYAWHGIGIGAPQARFWGVPVHQPEARAARLKDLVKNRLRFSAFELGEQAMERFFRRLAGFRPHYCYGYPSLMAEFCRYLKKSGRSLNHLPLKALIGTGEYLYPQERELLTEVGGAPVVDEYGCTEVGLVAFQCEQGAMHVMASNIHLEVIKDCRPVLDEEGDIYVTELHAGYCPFVRYGLGDRGLLSSERCRCGRALPVLKILSGRKDDYVLTPEGRKIYDAIFAYTLKEGVDQFRAVQYAPDRIVIDLKPDRSFTPDLGARYLAELTRLIGPSVRIELNLVASIERERSGKLRYFINRIGAATAGEG